MKVHFSKFLYVSVLKQMFLLVTREIHGFPIYPLLPLGQIQLKTISDMHINLILHYKRHILKLFFFSFM